MREKICFFFLLRLSCIHRVMFLSYVASEMDTEEFLAAINIIGGLITSRDEKEKKKFILKCVQKAMGKSLRAVSCLRDFSCSVSFRLKSCCWLDVLKYFVNTNRIAMTLKEIWLSFLKARIDFTTVLMWIRVCDSFISRNVSCESFLEKLEIMSHSREASKIKNKMSRKVSLFHRIVDQSSCSLQFSHPTST